MHPAEIEIKDYLYPLPAERIAAYPAGKRDQAALLVYRRGGQAVRALFSTLPAHLPEDSFLVFNDTRVFHARLLFQKASGAVVEVFCLHPLAPAASLDHAFEQGPPVCWDCLTGNARRWKEGKLSLDFPVNNIQAELQVERVNIAPGLHGLPAFSHVPLRFSWSPPGLTFGQVLEEAGKIPLPPYIHRPAVDSDRQRYQTTYARREGSVAAPTAGLHFTPEVFDALGQKNIPRLFLTLHVGAGTFKPVTAPRVGGHSMHAEAFSVSLSAIDSLVAMGDKKLIAVGTTTARTLESLYWASVRLLKGEPLHAPLVIEQWEPYQIGTTIDCSRQQALATLARWLRDHQQDHLQGTTRLLIAPPYRFKVMDGLITNFHQPGSTLLLLIAAYLGPAWREVYQFALDNDFRFLSYGDSCLFLP